MFGSPTTEVAIEKLPDSGKMNANVIAWSYGKEGHANKSVERYCESANKNIEQMERFSTPCIDDQQFRKKELETDGELPKSVLSNRPGMHAFGAHEVTKWTTACDKRLARLVSYIHYTKKCQSTMSCAKHCRTAKTGICQGPDFAGDLEDSVDLGSASCALSCMERSCQSIGCA